MKQPIEQKKETDVMETWRRHGFVPPSETKVDFKDCLAILDSLTIRKKKGQNNALPSL